ncbi:outer membrane protein transport protein [Luteimonas panaciterrae]|uniref:outer membrane protein transport protein n=1 Tax=Luteimonas panaciterrae TaxID=363885 RepID=UPI001CFA2E71|nr:outer membrane protein transport protein [Luteimonas panaciterrae]
MTNPTRLTQAILFTLASLFAVGHAHAAAFQLKEKSAKGQGRAFAGSISTPGDASVVADNPAAMRLLGGRVLQADLTAVNYSVEFSGTGQDAFGRPLSGGDGGDAGATSPLPALYFQTPIGERMHLGFSVTAPFGFKTDYGRSWLGRYHGTKTEIRTVDVGASFSYDVNPYVSFGGSVFIEHAQAKLNTAIDFGTLLAASGVPGYAPTSADGYSRIDASNNEWGFTIGGLFSPSEHTNIGIAYRSQVNHEPNDVDAHFDVPSAVQSILAVGRPGWFTDTRASTSLKLPATLTASFSHRLNDQWSIMADVSRTAWGKFQEVELDFRSPQANQVLNFGYRDTTFASIGTEYKANEKLTLRAGVAYDQSPVTNKVRDVRVPDTDRTWLSLGATWQVSESAEYSVGYTHLFVNDSKTDLVSATGSTLQGAFDVGGDILAFEGAWRF